MLELCSAPAPWLIFNSQPPSGAGIETSLCRSGAASVPPRAQSAALWILAGGDGSAEGSDRGQAGFGDGPTQQGLIIPAQDRQLLWRCQGVMRTCTRTLAALQRQFCQPLLDFRILFKVILADCAWRAVSETYPFPTYDPCKPPTSVFPFQSLSHRPIVRRSIHRNV